MDQFGAQLLVLQRIGSLEDIVRRSENSMVHVLSRLKDVEMALTTIHRTTEKTQPEIAFLAEEVGSLKRRVDFVDATWRTSVGDLAANVQAEFRKPAQVTPSEMHLRSEVQALRQDMADAQQFIRRVAEQAQADNGELRQLSSGARWAGEQIQALAQQHRESIDLNDKRIAQLGNELRSFAAEVDRNASAFRATFEGGVRAMHADLSSRIENEGRQRDGLQQDVQAAVTRLRDEVVRGLSLASTNIRSLEEGQAGLEMVLRAEVKARVQKTDEITLLVDELGSHFKRDSTSAAKLLREIDTDVGSALTTTMSAQQDTRNLIDQLFKGQKELRQAVEMIQLTAASSSPGSPGVGRTSSIAAAAAAGGTGGGGSSNATPRRQSTTGDLQNLFNELNKADYATVDDMNDLRREVDNLRRDVDDRITELSDNLRKEDQRISDGLLRVSSEVRQVNQRSKSEDKGRSRTPDSRSRSPSSRGSTPDRGGTSVTHVPPPPPNRNKLQEL